jgi:peptide/nickel transport system permease protein
MAANEQFAEIPLKKVGYTTKIYYPDPIEQERGVLSFFTGRKLKTTGIAYDSFFVLQDKVIFHTPLGYQKIITLNERKATSVIQDKINNTSINRTFILGTDKYGRDVLSRIILGIRISLMAGFIAVLVSLVLGVVLGCLAGYFRGWLDHFIMFIINITWSIPTILLVFAIVLAFGRGLGVIFIAVGLTMWVDVARIVRGQVMSLKEEQFVLAAKSIGQKPFKILLKHILPNIAGPILVVIAANFATAILIEAGLSYLGFGVPPPAPSLGNILNENYGYALSGNFVIAVLPALVIMTMVLSFNLIGSGLRDLYDVRED